MNTEKIVSSIIVIIIALLVYFFTVMDSTEYYYEPSKDLINYSKYSIDLQKILEKKEFNPKPYRKNQIDFI